MKNTIFFFVVCGVLICCHDYSSDQSNSGEVQKWEHESRNSPRDPKKDSINQSKSGEIQKGVNRPPNTPPPSIVNSKNNLIKKNIWDVPTRQEHLDKNPNYTESELKSKEKSLKTLMHDLNTIIKICIDICNNPSERDAGTAASMLSSVFLTFNMTYKAKPKHSWKEFELLYWQGLYDVYNNLDAKNKKSILPLFKDIYYKCIGADIAKYPSFKAKNTKPQPVSDETFKSAAGILDEVLAKAFDAVEQGIKNISDEDNEKNIKNAKKNKKNIDLFIAKLQNCRTEVTPKYILDNLLFNFKNDLIVDKGEIDPRVQNLADDIYKRHF